MGYKKKIINLKRLSLILGVALSVILVSCSKKEDNSTLSLKQESDHFMFYATDKDKEVLDELEKSLEDNYERISKNLGVKLERKVNVSIYPDIESFHDGIGMSDAEDWVVGAAKNGEMFMVSPSNPGSVHTYDNLMKVIVHEYAHILVGEINSTTDIYLNEGMAVVQANQIEENTKKFLKESCELNKLPTIDEIKNNFFELDERYELSGGFVEFLVNNYGYDKVTKIIAEPQNLENITELSKNELFENWKEYIVENY